MALTPIESQPATKKQIERVHTTAYIDHIAARSKQGLPSSILSTMQHNKTVQWYTRVSPGSYDAAIHAAGAVVQAVEDTLSGQCKRAFCAVRPPGHHAGPERGEGFCLFNNVAIGAYHALDQGAERVAIIDFDRHHGNGTQAIIKAQPTPRVFFVSSYQAGCKYSKATADPADLGLIKAFPISDKSSYEDVAKQYQIHVIPALQRFAPEVILISAGFDMHKLDPLTTIQLESDDYFNLTRMLVEVANDTAAGRVVSVLEGGYDVHALSSCVWHHLRALSL
jgi:acetoin utilization deacetylase AcuC-like enzyme